jgi:hypothetical protein
LSYVGGIGFISSGQQITLEANAPSSSFTMRLPNNMGTAGQFLSTDGSANTSWVSGNAGTVTSVGLSVPSTSIFGVTGSPVTSSGDLGLTTTGTQGGLPYFSSTSQLATSTAGTAGFLLTSGGTGAPTWTDPASLGSTTTLQQAYDNGANARIVLNSTQGTLSIRDAGTTITNLFEVTDNLGSPYLLVTPGETSFSTNIYTSGGIIVDNGVKFQDWANSFGITIIQPTLAADYTFTLPADDGDAGEVLTTDGSGVLTWEAPAVAVPEYNAYSADTTLTEENDQYVVCSGSGTDITLFACGASQAGKKVSIKRNDASNACAIVPDATGTADRIDGVAGSKSITVNLQAFTLVCDGSDDWYIF